MNLRRSFIAVLQSTSLGSLASSTTPSSKSAGPVQSLTLVNLAPVFLASLCLVVVASPLAAQPACNLASSNGIACVQSNDRTIDAASGTIAFYNSNTQGNLIVVVASATGGSTATPTDSIGNSYSTAVNNQLENGDSLSVYYAQNITAGSNTVSLSASGASEIQVVIFEFSGLASTGALDQSAAASGTSSVPASPSVTTTFAPELVMGAEFRVSAGPLSAGSGYTLEWCRDSCSDGNLATEDQILSSTENLAATWGGGSVAKWASAIATFHAALAPLTYSARTDMCSEFATDYINGASGTQCPAYQAANAGQAQVLAFQGAGTTNNATGVWTPSHTNGLQYLPNIDGYAGGGGSTHAGSALQCADSLGTGGCGGAATAMIDPDFGAHIFRATDYKTFGPGAANSCGETFGVGDNGQFAVWDLDSTAYILFNSEGAACLVFFSNNNDAYSTPTGIGPFGSTPPDCTTDCTAFASNEIVFSQVTPGVIWELDSRTKCYSGKGSVPAECTQGTAPYNQLNKLTLNKTNSPSGWTFSRTPIVNFTVGYSNSCTSGLPTTFVTNWSGSMNTSLNESIIAFAFSANGQGGTTAHQVVAYRAGYGCVNLTTTPDENGKMSYTGDWNFSGGDSGEVIIGNSSNQTACTVSGNPVACQDAMYLHAAGVEPIDTVIGIASAASAPISCIGAGGTVPCACDGITTGTPSAGLCENYYWNVGTPYVDFTKTTGHSASGNLYQYKGKFYTAFAFTSPEDTVGNLLPTTEPYTPPVDQHLSYWNANSQDKQPVLGFTTNVCGLGGSGVGSSACPNNYSAVCASNPIKQCPEVNEIMGAQNSITNTITTCPISGGGSYSGGCIYRFAHNFGSGTSWYFETQNMVGNVSPNGRWAVFASDWFAGIGNWPLGCTDGTTVACLDNISANGNNPNYTVSGVSNSGTTYTFTTGSLATAGYSPATWIAGDDVTITGFTPTGYNGTFTILSSPVPSATSFSITISHSPGAVTTYGTANWDTGADKYTPLPRGDVFVVDLESAN